MRTPGLRTRATLLGTATFAVLLTVGAVVLVAMLDSRLTASSDQVDRARLGELLTLAETDQLPAVLRTPHDNAMAQVVGAGGTIRAASANLRAPVPVADLSASSTPRVATFEAPDDAETETYRVWYAEGASPSGPVTVYVGSSLENVREATTALRHTLLIGIPIVVVGLGLVIWLLIGRVIGRLDRIRAEVDAITAQSLDRRVAGDSASDEVGRLARTMNSMLDRLEDSARRQRDFIADVSHDLQSPLAGQRAILEVAIADPDGTDASTIGTEALRATAEMEHLVGDLLVVASVDAEAPPRSQPFDLDELVLEEAMRARPGARVRIETHEVSAAPAFGVPGDIRRVIRNLVENAVTHASSSVTLIAGLEDGTATLEVIDDGPGIPVEDRDRVFDRFYRSDRSRRRSHGSGLGLAIARSLAERSGGSVAVLDSLDGARFRLTLPVGGQGTSPNAPSSDRA